MKKAFDGTPAETPETAEGKTHAAKLAAFYSACKKFAGNTESKTVGDFLEAYYGAANDSGFLPPGALRKLRETVGLKLAAILRTDYEKANRPGTTKSLVGFNRVDFDRPFNSWSLTHGTSKPDTAAGANTATTTTGTAKPAPDPARHFPKHGLEDG